MVAEITEEMAKVKEFLNVWAEWMHRSGTAHLGYGESVGFNNGTVSGWDDFERRVKKNMAINIQGIYDGLKPGQQQAIDHFHLSAVWRFNRGTLEEEYQNALIAIEAALKRRGLI